MHHHDITIRTHRYPAMTRVAELMGHTERVLGLCLSPDTSTLVSAGADETLRFVMMDVCYNANWPKLLVTNVLVPGGTDDESLQSYHMSSLGWRNI